MVMPVRGSKPNGWLLSVLMKRRVILTISPGPTVTVASCDEPGCDASTGPGILANTIGCDCCVSVQPTTTGVEYVLCRRSWTFTREGMVTPWFSTICTA